MLIPQAHTQTIYPHTQQCGQCPHVLLHQGVDLLFGEAPDAMAVHLPAYHAAVQVAQQPLQSVAERAAHRQKFLGFLQVVYPLTVGYCPAENTQSGQRQVNGGTGCVTPGMGLAPRHFIFFCFEFTLTKINKNKILYMSPVLSTRVLLSTGTNILSNTLH